MPIVGCQIEPARREHREQVVKHLRERSSSPLLVLDTCQRLESFGYEEPCLEDAIVVQRQASRDAFERLARIAAGLESRILGELEILGQVRAAYREFREMAHGNDTLLDRIFQDAISLARKARRESGIDRNLTSLSGLAARELLARVPAGMPVAVIGAGSLAGSVARYLSKRGDSPVVVSSRCPERAEELADEVGGFGAGLDDLAHLLRGVAGIVTATAAPHPVLYAQHLSEARRPLAIVDLGAPPDCGPEIPALSGVDYLDLMTIEAKAQINTEERRTRATLAGRIIQDGALEWSARMSDRLHARKHAAQKGASSTRFVT